MKIQSIIMAGTVSVLLLASYALAQERIIVEFTGSPAPPATGVPYPVRGVIKCLGAGDPAPAGTDMPPWCPTGTQTSASNRVQAARWTTSDPNTTGDITWFHNFTVDSATFAGTWWGSFMLNVPGRGMWQGWYWGESYVGGAWQLRLIGVGFGAFNLYTFMAEATVTDPTKPPAITGRYLKPRSQ
jgi:hypothetical protein